MRRTNILLLCIVIVCSQINLVAFYSSENTSEEKMTVNEIGRVSGSNSSTYNIAIYRSYGYLADYTVLRVLDLSDLSNPLELATLNISAIDVNFDKSHLYILEMFRFLIYDLSNPNSPVFVNSLDVNGSVLQIENSIAYIGGGPYFQIVDISKPSHPMLLSSYFTGSYTNLIYQIALFKPYAYLGTRSSVLILDITDLSNPVLVNSLGTCRMVACGVSINNSYLFVVNFTIGLDIYSLQNPGSPQFVSHFSAYLTNVAITGQYAFLSENNLKIKIIDLFNVSNPLSNSSMSFDLGGADAENIVFNGSIAFCTSRWYGLNIVNISNILSPKLISNFDYPTDNIHSIYVQGDYLFQACNNEGLNIYSIKDFYHPVLVGNLLIPSVDKIIVSDSIAYLVMSSYSIIKIVNVSDLSSPKLLSSFPVGHEATRDLFLTNHYLLLANDYGIDVVDVSNSSNPRLMGSYKSTDKSYDVSVSGDLVFVADGKNGLTLFNSSELNFPFEFKPVTNFKTSTSDVRGVVYNGKYLFLSDNLNGLQVINIDNIFNPFLESNVNGKNSLYMYSTIIDNKLFTTNNKIITIFDITNPLSPTFTDHMINYNIYDIFVTSNNIFLASGSSGTPIFKWGYENVTSFSKTSNTTYQSSEGQITTSPIDIVSFLAGLLVISILVLYINSRKRR